MLLIKGRLTRSILMAAVLAVGILFTTSSAVMAQQQENMPPQQMQPDRNFEVSEEELESFAVVVGKMDSINQEVNQKMIETVQDNDLEVEQYNQIVEKLESVDDPNDLNVDQETVEKAVETSNEIRQIQTQTTQKMNMLIQDEGLAPNRFEMILQLVNNDPQMRKRFEEVQQDG